jgi:hypothetical protein
MARWTAQVFVNSNVGRITAEVEAATFSGAKEQIYAKYGKVQSITNLRQVRGNSSDSSSSSDGDGTGTVALIGIFIVFWVLYMFTPWILMGLGGAFGTWVGEKCTGMSIVEYGEGNEDTGHKKAAIILTLALFLGGVGFVKGTQWKADFDKPESSPPAKIQQVK